MCPQSTILQCVYVPGMRLAWVQLCVALFTYLVWCLWKNTQSHRLLFFYRQLICKYLKLSTATSLAYEVLVILEWLCFSSPTVLVSLYGYLSWARSVSYSREGQDFYRVEGELSQSLQLHQEGFLIGNSRYKFGSSPFFVEHSVPE